MIDNGLRVIDSNDAAEAFLKLRRSFPRLINVLIRKIFEGRDPFSDVCSMLILCLEECNGRVYFPILVEEGR